jgi:hypothetical protein
MAPVFSEFSKIGMDLIERAAELPSMSALQATLPETTMDRPSSTLRLSLLSLFVISIRDLPSSSPSTPKKEKAVIQLLPLKTWPALKELLKEKPT